jgi:hypothetical protein
MILEITSEAIDIVSHWRSIENRPRVLSRENPFYEFWGIRSGREATGPLKDPRATDHRLRLTAAYFGGGIAS